MKTPPNPTLITNGIFVLKILPGKPNLTQPMYPILKSREEKVDIFFLDWLTFRKYNFIN